MWKTQLRGQLSKFDILFSGEKTGKTGLFYYFDLFYETADDEIPSNEMTRELLIVEYSCVNITVQKYL